MKIRKPLVFIGALFFLQSCASQQARFDRLFHYAPYRFAGPAPEAECREFESWKWCVDKPDSSAAVDEKSVLYVLHHAGGSERTWSESPVARKFYAQLLKQGAAAPRVVSVSYGPYWTLMEEAGEKQPALLRPFVDTLMPEIERSLGMSSPKRLLWGMSQGGLNGASLILREQQLFARAVLSCPAIYSFPLYSDSAADTYIERVKANRESVYWGLEKLRPRIGGANAWRREGPLGLIGTVKSLPPTLMQVNVADEYGFQEGGKMLFTRAKSRGFPVEIQTYGNSHCVIDAERAVNFLFNE